MIPSAPKNSTRRITRFSKKNEKKNEKKKKRRKEKGSAGGWLWLWLAEVLKNPRFSGREKSAVWRLMRFFFDFCCGYREKSAFQRALEARKKNLDRLFGENAD